MTNHETLVTEAEQLADLILQCSEIEEYQVAEKRLNEVPEVMSLMRRLRDVQEQIGDFIARNVPEAHYQHLANDMESLLTELEAIPEVQTFMAAQTRLNDLIQSVTQRLSTALEPGTY